MIIALLGILTLFIPGCNYENNRDRPNFVFIIIDDLRTALGCYGDPLAITPNIDKLAGRGFLFNHAYAQQAVCNPSRTSLMTGKRPDNIRVWDNRVHFRSSFPETVTLPQFLAQNGYQTQAIGKIYHDPAWAQDSLSWTEPALHVVTTTEGKYANEENLSLNKGKADAWEVADDPGESYIDIRVRNAAVNYLENQKKEPFFLAVGFRRPHLPFSAPREFWDMHSGKDFYPVPNAGIPVNSPGISFAEYDELGGYYNIPDGREYDSVTIATLRKGYYASTSYIDHLVGQLMEALENNQLLENSIVILTTDHGYHIGEHDWWCKTTNFELDARVPLIIFGPGKEGGRTSDALVELVDLYPTIVECCGLKVPEALDGKSMLHLLRDPAGSHKPFAITQFPRPWFYEDQPEVMGYSIRTPEMRYTEWVDWNTREMIARELYDHRMDGFEMLNVAGHPEYANEVIKLEEMMREISCSR